MIKYFLFTILMVLICMQHKYEIYILDDILLHVYLFMPWYSGFIAFILLIKVFKTKSIKKDNDYRISELSEVVTKNTLIQSSQLLRKVLETDFSNDEAHHKTRDTIINIMAELNILKSIVTAEKHLDKLFKTCKKEVTSQIQNYEVYK